MAHREGLAGELMQERGTVGELTEAGLLPEEEEEEAAAVGVLLGIPTAEEPQLADGRTGPHLLADRDPTLGQQVRNSRLLTAGTCMTSTTAHPATRSLCQIRTSLPATKPRPLPGIPAPARRLVRHGATWRA